MDCIASDSSPQIDLPEMNFDFALCQDISTLSYVVPVFKAPYVILFPNLSPSTSEVNLFSLYKSKTIQLNYIHQRKRLALSNLMLISLTCLWIPLISSFRIVYYLLPCSRFRTYPSLLAHFYNFSLFSFYSFLRKGDRGAERA